MVLKKLHHTVTRPGRRPDDQDVEIKIAEELATVPGIPKIDADIMKAFSGLPLPHIGHFIKLS